MEARDSDSNFYVSVSDLMVNAWRLQRQRRSVGLTQTLFVAVWGVRWAWIFSAVTAGNALSTESYS